MIEYASEGGEVPRPHLDLDQAWRAFQARDWQRACDLFVRLLDLDGPIPVEALEAFALCCSAVGRIPEACKAMEQAFATLVNQGETRRAAMAAVRLVALSEILGIDAACQGWEQRALRLVEDLGPCVERGYLALCRTGCEYLDPADLEARAELALQLASRFGDKDLELRARVEKGLALVSQGQVNAGFSLIDEAMVAIAAGEMHDDAMRGRSICSVLSACERTGDIGRAEYWCRRIEQEPNLQHLLLGAHCRVTYGVVEALRGEWEKAEALLTEVLQTGVAVSFHRAASVGRLAEIQIQQGKVEAAAEVLKGYEDRFEVVPALARLRMIEGKYDQASALLRHLIRGLGQDTIRLVPVLALLAEVELLRHDRARAEQVVEHLRALEERSESNEIRAHARLAAGRLARYKGDLAGAVEELETALTLLIHYERPLLRAQIRLELARALQALDAVGQAAVEAEAALATFRRLGVVVDATVAAELLLALTSGTRAKDGDHASDAVERELPSCPNQLTSRENEVASLVAQGLTNREIAERLVLSVRTVEGHIDRILGKLDFHTRTQLAMWVGAAQAAASPPGD